MFPRKTMLSLLIASFTLLATIAVADPEPTPAPSPSPSPDPVLGIEGSPAQQDPVASPESTIQTTDPEVRPVDELQPADGLAMADPPGTQKNGIYLHIGGGIGLAFMSSDTITDLFGDEFAIGLGMHFSMSASIGYRNLVQAEVRRGDSSHTLRDNNIVTNESTEIPMDYDFTEYLAKLNLLYLLTGGKTRSETALFLVAGTADIDYVDEISDGFTGGGTVYGFEFTRFSPGRGVAATVGLRRYGIEFDQITLFGETGRVTVEASNWVLHTAFTFGLGL